MSSEFFERVARASSTVIRNSESPKALSAVEVLATAGWFKARRESIKSTGGRPSNADWTIKRQVPMTSKTWEALQHVAEGHASTGRALGASQVAAILLEGAVEGELNRSSFGKAKPTLIGSTSSSGTPSTWKQPALFGGRPRQAA